MGYILVLRMFYYKIGLPRTDVPSHFCGYPWAVSWVGDFQILFLEWEAGPLSGKPKSKVERKEQ